jgi:antigen flippase
VLLNARERIFHGRSFPALLTLSTSLAVQALSLLTGALTARLLGVEGRGAFAACTLLPLIISGLGDLGGPLAYTVHSAQNPKIAPSLVRNAYLIGIVLGTVLVIICSALTPLVLSNYRQLVLPSIVFGILYIPPLLLGNHLNAINQGTGHIVSFNIARMVNPLVYCVSIIVLLAIGKSSTTAALIGPVLGVIAFLLVVLIQVRAPRRGLPLLDAGLLKKTYNYGLRAHLGRVAPIDTFRVDLALVLIFLNAQDAGLYSVAVAAAMVVRAQATSVGLVAIPAIARQPTEQGKVSRARFFFHATTGLVLTLGLLLVLFAHPLVALVYGDAFIAAAPTMQLLVGAMILASVRQSLGDVLRALDAPGIGSIAEVACWVALIIVTPILIPRLGVNGAAVGVMIAYAAALIVTIVLMLRRDSSLRYLLTVHFGELVEASRGLRRTLRHSRSNA